MLHFTVSWHPTAFIKFLDCSRVQWFTTAGCTRAWVNVTNYRITARRRNRRAPKTKEWMKESRFVTAKLNRYPSVISQHNLVQRKGCWDEHLYINAPEDKGSAEVEGKIMQHNPPACLLSELGKRPASLLCSFRLWYKHHRDVCLLVFIWGLVEDANA